MSNTTPNYNQQEFLKALPKVYFGESFINPAPVTIIQDENGYIVPNYTTGTVLSNIPPALIMNTVINYQSMPIPTGMPFTTDFAESPPYKWPTADIQMITSPFGTIELEAGESLSDVITQFYEWRKEQKKAKEIAKLECKFHRYVEL